MRKKLKLLFWGLLISFLVISAQLFIPPFTELMTGKIFLVPIVIFGLLGIGLILVIQKEKTKRNLKKPFLLSGGGAAGFLIFTVLHNLFYALEIVSKNIFIVNWLMKILSVISFLISIFVCPIAFLIGVIQVLVLNKKERGNKPPE